MKYQEFENWVTFIEAATVDEASIIKAMLEASKIPVVLDREAASSLADYSGGAEDEVVVKVPKEMVARATQLLKSTTPYGVPEE